MRSESYIASQNIFVTYHGLSHRARGVRVCHARTVTHDPQHHARIQTIRGEAQVIGIDLLERIQAEPLDEREEVDDRARHSRCDVGDSWSQEKNNEAPGLVAGGFFERHSLDLRSPAE